MRNWKHQLYFDAMPGRYRPIEEWQSDIASDEIDLIICLTGKDEIRRKSPSYAALRSRSPDGIAVKNGTVTRTIPLADFPIPDFGVPSEKQVPRFWDLAYRVANLVAEGGRVFIHCGAGIGRTGTFATAVLMILGNDVAHATAEVNATDSHPETDAQLHLLRTGLPQDDPSSLDDQSLETEDHRFAFADQQSRRERHQSLRTFGVGSILNLFSRGWPRTDAPTKLEAFRSLVRAGTPMSGPELIRSQVPLAEISAAMLTMPRELADRVGVSLAAATLIEVSFGSVDSMPGAPAEIAAARTRFDELANANEQYAVKRRLESSGLPGIHRKFFDSLSAEGGSVSWQERFEYFKGIISAGISLRDVAGAYYHAISSHKPHALGQLPIDLFQVAVLGAFS